MPMPPPTSSTRSLGAGMKKPWPKGYTKLTLSPYFSSHFLDEKANLVVGFVHIVDRDGPTQIGLRRALNLDIGELARLDGQQLVLATEAQQHGVAIILTVVNLEVGGLFHGYASGVSGVSGVSGSLASSSVKSSRPLSMSNWYHWNTFLISEG